MSLTSGRHFDYWSPERQLMSWFFDRLKASNIPLEEIKEATVKAGIKTDRIATNRKKIVSFDFTLQSVI